MRVFKRGKYYWYEFILDGKRYQRSTKLRNNRDAEAFADAERTALRKGEVGIHPRKKVPGFKTAMADFLKWSAAEHQAKPGTHRRYKVSSRALLSHFKDEALDKITQDAVERFKAKRAAENTTVLFGKKKDGKRKPTKKKLRPATVNRELACLKALFNHALKSHETLRNPVSRVKPLEEDNQQTRVLSYEEQEQYLAAATPMLRDVATLILESGMRPEEVYRIRPENVHLSDGHLFNPFGKTKAARRRVPLTSLAKSVLGRRMEGLERPYLFPCETDAARPVPKVNNAHDRAVRDSKVAPFRLYDLRHTWATRAAMSGVDLVTLAAMLGHSKIQMVLRYAHPTQEHQQKAMEKLEQYVAEQRISDAEQRASIQPSTIQ